MNSRLRNIFMGWACMRSYRVQSVIREIGERFERSSSANGYWLTPSPSSVEWCKALVKPPNRCFHVVTGSRYLRHEWRDCINLTRKLGKYFQICFMQVLCELLFLSFKPLSHLWLQNDQVNGFKGGSNFLHAERIQSALLLLVSHFSTRGSRAARPRVAYWTLTMASSRGEALIKEHTILVKFL